MALFKVKGFINNCSFTGVCCSDNIPDIRTNIAAAAHLYYSLFINLFNIFLVVNKSDPLKWTESVVDVLASSAVSRGFGPQSGQTKDNKIGISVSPLSTHL